MAITNGYTTLAALKAMLGITGSTEDAKLEGLIEDASRSIDADTGQYFYSDAGTYHFDALGGDRLLLDRPLQSVTTLTTDSEVDGTFDGETWVEDTDFVLCPVNSAVKWFVKVLAWGNYALPDREYSVKIVGVFGWASVPRLIASECLWRAKVDYQHYGAREEFESETIGDYRYKRYAAANVRKAELARVSAFRERRFG